MAELEGVVPTGREPRNAHGGLKVPRPGGYREYVDGVAVRTQKNGARPPKANLCPYSLARRRIRFATDIAPRAWLTCRVCAETWHSLKQRPVRCPRCGTRRWRTSEEAMSATAKDARP